MNTETSIQPLKTAVIVTLSNGVTVANFSSPHSFKFTDGNELAAVSNFEAEELKIDFIETPSTGVTDTITDISLDFAITQAVRDRMDFMMKSFDIGLVDVVLCPLPMITALKAEGFNLKRSPFRAVRMENRIEKLVSINKFCI